MNTAMRAAEDRPRTRTPVDTARTHTDRGRAESFGAVALAYDRHRPSYPPALFDALLAPRPRRVLDVGCGTGKASVALAARGADVLGVEIDDRMAGVARSHGIAVEVGAFESWDDGGRRFDLITCAQAWHWVDSSVGSGRAHRLLEPGGRLALFWNFAHFADDTQAAMDAVYDAAAPELLRHSVLRGGGPATVPGHVHDLRAGGFGAVEHRRYPWPQEYSTAQWLALIRTHSDHAQLPPARLVDLLDRVGVLIDGFGGVLHVRYITELLLAHR